MATMTFEEVVDMEERIKREGKFETAEITQKLADENKTTEAVKKLLELRNKHRQPGVFERYMNDICEYLCSKFPDKSLAEMQEVAGYIANRATVMASDLIMERDKHWEYAMRKSSPKVRRVDRKE